MKPTIIFLGSFGQYSATVLEELLKSDLITVKHVVTTPPFINRKKKQQKGAVQLVAEAHNIDLTIQMPNLFSDISSDFEADFIITAGYGKLLPPKLLSEPNISSLNLHFSLLPKYRGANPGEWAILMNEKETGITVIEMNENFDEGGTIFAKSTPITNEDNRETVYERLYLIGGQVLSQVIVDFAQKKLVTKSQPKTDDPYATRLKKNDGFISWKTILKTIDGESAPIDSLSRVMTKIISLQGFETINAKYIERASRALYGFPSLWTIIPTTKGDKRMKIHSAKVEGNKLILLEVQVEGQTKAKWNQVKNILKQ